MPQEIASPPFPHLLSTPIRVAPAMDDLESLSELSEYTFSLPSLPLLLLEYVCLVHPIKTLAFFCSRFGIHCLVIFVRLEWRHPISLPFRCSFCLDKVNVLS